MSPMVLMVLTLMTSSVASPARAFIGTLRLNVTDNLPHTDSVLPFFKFMNSGNEGGVGYNMKLQNVPTSAYDSLSDALPDYLLNESHVMKDLKNKVLPYRMKDGWAQARTVQDVEVASLENDVLRIDVTPLWGGRIHRALHKPTGRYLSYFNPEHASVNDGTLRSCELGGIEWNWSPGQIGHTVYSENPVYVARLKTAHGDALRVYEYDRWNGTVWQVDLHLRDAQLWAHARVVNPTPVDLPGYWWTNVQMPMTSSTWKGKGDAIGGSRCTPSDPSWSGSRVLSPAWGAVTGEEVGGVARLGLTTWPHEALGVSRVVTRDRSHLSNYSGDADTFLQCTGWDKTAAPFIAIVDQTHWGSSHGVLHGHGTPFNKIWTMGMDDSHAWSETPQEWNGCFVELQVGVAPTQSHTFALRANSSHHHSEWWQLLDGLDEADVLYGEDYTAAVDSVADFVNSDSGVPHAAWTAMDGFLAEVSAMPLDAADVLFNGSAWGALDARLTRATPPPSVRFFEAPVSAFEGEDVLPWLELLGDGGTFSERTLNATPRSFVAGGRGEWADLLLRSAKTHGWTWLHHLHLGTESAERFDLASARKHFAASAKIRPNAHALRGLAILSSDAAERQEHFAQAWDLAMAVQTVDPAAHLLRANLADEIAFSLRAYAVDPSTPPKEASKAWDTLQRMLERFDETFGGEEGLGATAAGGSIAIARASLALARGDPQRCLEVLARHPFAHWYHGPRRPLVGLWLQAQLAAETAAKGRPLTAIERKRVKYDPKRAPPRSLGALDRPWFEAPAGSGWPSN